MSPVLLSKLIDYVCHKTSLTGEFELRKVLLPVLISSCCVSATTSIKTIHWTDKICMTLQHIYRKAAGIVQNVKTGNATLHPGTSHHITPTQHH